MSENNNVFGKCARCGGSLTSGHNCLPLPIRLTPETKTGKIKRLEQESQVLKAQSNELRVILTSLVNLKAHKDKWGKDELYLAEQPCLWSKARRAIVSLPQESLDTLKAEITDPLQYKIDELMLEYCPDEMTMNQIANWESHQRKYQSSANENQINSKTEDK